MMHEAGCLISLLGSASIKSCMMSPIEYGLHLPQSPGFLASLQNGEVAISPSSLRGLIGQFGDFDWQSGSRLRAMQDWVALLQLFRPPPRAMVQTVNAGVALKFACAGRCNNALATALSSLLLLLLLLCPSVLFFFWSNVLESLPCRIDV